MRIYLDHQATTPPDPRVVEALLPSLRERFGNPASRSHVFGWEAAEAVEEARSRVAALVGAVPEEIVFTSGATEAIDLALHGVAEMYAARGRHVVTCATEHRAVLDTCRQLESEGWEVTYLEPTPTGRARVEDVESALRPDTVLVALMGANNEVGTLHPIRDVGATCHAREVLFFVDATQSAGKVPVDVRDDGIDLLCLSGHKMHGIKGAGALYVRRRDPRVRLAPRIRGGGHERGLRSGTPNVPGIVGLGAACEIAAAEREEEAARCAALRDRLEESLRSALDGVRFNGDREHRLPGCLNLSFEGADAEDLLLRLGREVALSSGAACSSADGRPSHVLRAMGLPPDRAATSLRLGIGRFTTEEEVDLAAERVVAAVRAARS